ncbi:peptide-methionine (S)-S-oxide reductase MsrA [Sneathiella sp. P13V-1]|uniref:peptide-methionine (S)-S-oxide reductase MsrA n=1 Tax=Sneathiella sp. P13V-1 TaxID=2697366 RepID=UPI00187B942A|nr:peptide-methionine (S)-S-oxide reductase MsrA [Sneathiella sp. P13V-1]MBE7635701.1 peptide-methionine (S)-S-oxide reductase MsrA [Sneathiella sp. P13V-1]
MGNGSQIAYFGAGCFWGVEAAYRNVEGVIETAVGYQGGHKISPTYEEVCSGTTQHAEVVAVRFDPAKVSYEQLLNVFWQSHNPTTLNRQGPDIGTQYRSVIFYCDDAQKEAAERSKQALTDAKAFRDPIVTIIEQAPDFYPAEDYHQQYLEKRGLATCRI